MADPSHGQSPAPVRVSASLLDLDFPAGTVSIVPAGSATGDSAREPLAGHLARWRASIHPDDLPAVERALEECRRGGTAAYRADYRMTLDAASSATVSDAGAAVVRDPSGGALRMVIARMVALPSAAGAGPRVCDAQAVRRLGHALNNQLAAVQGYSELMLEEPGMSQETHEDVQALFDATRRAAEIVDQLMALAR